LGYELELSGSRRFKTAAFCTDIDERSEAEGIINYLLLPTY